MQPRKELLTDPATVKAGDLIAVIHYAKVQSANNGGSELFVEDVDSPGKIIRIQGKELVARTLSADSFFEESDVTKTEAAQLLVESYNRPFTVNFIKADGSERTLRGRLIHPEPLMGRSMVEDLDALAPKNIRQVDHRTINWLIVNGVKYVVL